MSIYIEVKGEGLKKKQRRKIAEHFTRACLNAGLTSRPEDVQTSFRVIDPDEYYFSYYGPDDRIEVKSLQDIREEHPAGGTPHTQFRIVVAGVPAQTPQGKAHAFINAVRQTVSGIVQTEVETIAVNLHYAVGTAPGTPGLRAGG